MTTTALHRTEPCRIPAAKGPSALPRMTRPFAALLLAALVAALAVAAERWVETWADGQLLTAWLVIWAVIFAAILLTAGVARRVALRTLTGLASWSRARQQARAEAMLRELVHGDERLLADISLVVDTACAADAASEPYDADAARSANIDEEIATSTLRLRRAHALM